MTEGHPSFAERLASPDAGVRRLAAKSLARHTDRAAAATLLAERLPDERDETVLLAIIRALGRLGVLAHRPALAQVRDNPSSTPRVRHAALLAHDRLERIESLASSDNSDTPTGPTDPDRLAP